MRLKNKYQISGVVTQQPILPYESGEIASEKTLAMTPGGLVTCYRLCNDTDYAL